MLVVSVKIDCVIIMQEKSSIHKRFVFLVALCVFFTFCGFEESRVLAQSNSVYWPPIGPEVAAAVGFTTSSYPGLVANLDSRGSEFADVEIELRQAEAAEFVLQQALDHLHESSDRNGALAEARTLAENARRERLEANVALEAVRQSVLDASGAWLSSSDLELLANCMASAHRRVPAEYQVLRLEDHQWESLARSVWKRAEGKQVSGEELQLLAQCDNHPSVIIARRRIQIHGDALRQIYEQRD